VTTDEFDTLAGTEKEIEKRRQQQLDEDTKRRGGGGGDMTFLTSSLMNLVAPTQDSTGMRLLRKMGWRIGQGVGPRTAFVKDDDQDDDDSSNLQQQMTLAPKDTPIVDYQPKTNTFGLGYDLVTNVPQVAEMRRFQQQQQDQQHEQKTRGGGSGFGLGVFDDDEEDIMLYDDEKQPGLDRKYHHTLYDDNESALSTTGIKKRKQSMSTTSGDHTIKRARCSDGHLPLKGFHLSTQPQQLGKW
jgi:G patch domain-containing protein 1